MGSPALDVDRGLVYVGREILVTGQKSEAVWALDPDAGVKSFGPHVSESEARCGISMPCASSRP